MPETKLKGRNIVIKEGNKLYVAEKTEKGIQIRSSGTHINLTKEQLKELEALANA